MFELLFCFSMKRLFRARRGFTFLLFILLSMDIPLASLFCTSIRFFHVWAMEFLLAASKLVFWCPISLLCINSRSHAARTRIRRHVIFERFLVLESVIRCHSLSSAVHFVYLSCPAAESATLEQKKKNVATPLRCEQSIAIDLHLGCVVCRFWCLSIRSMVHPSAPSKSPIPTLRLTTL